MSQRKSPTSSTMFVNKSILPSLENDYKTNNGFGHSKETLSHLDFIFSLYKQIDIQPLNARFQHISSVFLNVQQMKKVVNILSNLKPDDELIGPLIHFKKLIFLRTLILSIVNRQQLLFHKSEKIEEFDHLFADTPYYEALREIIFKYSDNLNDASISADKSPTSRRENNYAIQNLDLKMELSGQSYANDKQSEYRPGVDISIMEGTSVANYQANIPEAPLDDDLLDMNVPKLTSRVNRIISSNPISQFKVRYISTQKARPSLIRDAKTPKIRLADFQRMDYIQPQRYGKFVSNPNRRASQDIVKSALINTEIQSSAGDNSEFNDVLAFSILNKGELPVSDYCSQGIVAGGKYIHNSLSLKKVIQNINSKNHGDSQEIFAINTKATQNADETPSNSFRITSSTMYNSSQQSPIQNKQANLRRNITQFGRSSSRCRGDPKIHCRRPRFR
ncbi:hypothetical protein FGO68_gene17368 [Halteria grandinella]|uniref:Uncharacterized protein n=1 Tax=Halteria grandinella TaxID=5974 RepID=A0A8J8T798_HALGN|nr:hypothetical protein FGO68_gene17368 [Halteria grandinella]